MSSDYLTSENVNRTQYFALLLMVAKATGYKPGLFTYNVANLHLYDRHIEQAKEIYESMKVTFQNVERKLINIKIDLDETLQMLYKLKNENGQQR